MNRGEGSLAGKFSPDWCECTMNCAQSSRQSRVLELPKNSAMRSRRLLAADDTHPSDVTLPQAPVGTLAS